MAVILNFKCTTGAGDGDYSRPHPLGSFDTHARWQPVTQSARSRRSYGKIEDCEQSNDSEAFWSSFYILFGFLCARVSSGIARQWSRRSPGEGGGGTWVFFWVGMCPRDFKLTPRSKKNSPKIDTPF